MPLHCLLGQSDLLFSFLLWQFYYALFLSMVILSFFFVFQGRCCGNRYMGGFIWEKWDASWLACAWSSNGPNCSASDEVGSYICLTSTFFFTEDLIRWLKNLQVSIFNACFANVMWLIWCFLVLAFTCSVWVMMNKLTRRLSKIPEEVRAEIGPYFVDRHPIIDEDSRKVQKLEDNTADFIKRGLNVSLWSASLALADLFACFCKCYICGL